VEAFALVMLALVAGLLPAGRRRPCAVGKLAERRRGDDRA
jgi:hypothetical protein